MPYPLEVKVNSDATLISERGDYSVERSPTRRIKASTLFEPITVSSFFGSKRKKKHKRR